MAQRKATAHEAGQTRTVVYVRVSTEKQADHGLSLEAQQAKIRAYAELYGLELVETVLDAGLSAKSLKRPGLARALAMLKSGEAEALLVVKPDRLTRSVWDLGRLVADYFAAPNGPALLSVSEQVDTRTAAGRLVLNVLGAVSQWEREAIGERTSIAMRHMSWRGQYVGRAPRFGYRLAQDGRLEALETEQAAIREARALRAAGLSLRAVASRLESQGFRTRADVSFAAVQVRRMLEAA